MKNHESFGESEKLPIESADDAVLRMFSGAIFGPGAKFILPSGKELGGNEMQAFTSAFEDPDRIDPVELHGVHAEDSTLSLEATKTSKVPEIGIGDNPLDSHFDDWTDDHKTNLERLQARAMMAAEMSMRNPNKPAQKKTVEPELTIEEVRKKKWWEQKR